MSCTVIRHTEGPNAGGLKDMIFTCDHEGCEAQPDDTEIISKGGMRAMGWYASGGRHFCPEHAEEVKIERDRTQ